MRRILFLLFLLINFVMHAQQASGISHCGTPENEQRLENRDPARASLRTAYEAQIQEWISHHTQTQSVITIPVVVHVIWHTAAQDISDNQVLSQIQVLNDDFGRMNADTTNTPAAFLPVAANTGIQFCLAQQDPNGNATNGIEHVQTAITSFSANDAMKHSAQGGADAWDPSRYFNFWVCNLGNGMLSYSEQPISTLSQTFGVVALYSVFGSNYTVFGTFTGINAPYDRGRDVVHEVAHCLNLFHTWGDDGGACTGTDYVSDTPNEADAVLGCPSFPYYDACTASGNGIMYSNFMDATDESCRNIFTTGQKLRMQAMLNTWPYNNLQNSVSCFQPSQSPPVTLYNGVTEICVGDSTSFTDVSSGNPFAWSWDLPGALPNTSSVQNPVNIYWPYAGTYSVTLTATNANGSSNYTGFVLVHAMPATPTVVANGNTLSSTVSGAAYQWLLNGAVIPGATGSTYTATQSGNYSVIVYNAFGCASDTSAPLTDPLSAGPENSFQELTVTPNPNAGNFVLTFSPGNNGPFVVEIYNALGEIVFSISIAEANGKFALPVNISAYGSGIYFLRLTGANSVSTRKLVVH